MSSKNAYTGLSKIKRNDQGSETEGARLGIYLEAVMATPLHLRSSAQCCERYEDAQAAHPCQEKVVHLLAAKNVETCNICAV